MDNPFDEIMSQLGWYYVDDTPDAVDVQSINELERNLGFKLPTDYREFLLKFGITTVADDVGIESPESSELESTVDVFYGIKSQDSYDLMERKVGFGEELPKHLLPIASASGGQLCISFGDSDNGAVYWWYPHDSYDDNRSEEFEPISASFRLFLQRLRRFENR